MMRSSFPRLMLAGAAGDSGKTLISLALLASMRQQGEEVAAFKKGPDYIDAAWLSWASGRPCRNLDTFMQPRDAILDSLRRHAGRDLSLIEGNRGFLDGLDAEGSHSSASLARLLEAPVILVLNVTKMTRTAAAVVKGCQVLEPDARIRGVIVNQVANPRQASLLQRVIPELCGLPVLGALPRQRGNPLPGRHLGLVTPAEHPTTQGLDQRLSDLARQHLDLPAILDLARGAGDLPSPDAGWTAPQPPSAPAARDLRIGYFRDSAFTFYYPENLEAIQNMGAILVPISALADRSLPPIDALYLGGGFPETHAEALGQNMDLMAAIRTAAEAGLPIYAECGGLIYLGRGLTVEGRRHAMAGVLPCELALCHGPQGHGYVEAVVDRPNPYFPTGMVLRGHEFHYTRITDGATALSPCLQLRRGTGTHQGRDGVVYKNVMAGYTHLHALGLPQWAAGLLGQAACFRGQRQTASDEQPANRS